MTMTMTMIFLLKTIKRDKQIQSIKQHVLPKLFQFSLEIS